MKVFVIESNKNHTLIESLPPHFEAPIWDKKNHWKFFDSFNSFDQNIICWYTREPPPPVEPLMGQETFQVEFFNFYICKTLCIFHRPVFVILSVECSEGWGTDGKGGCEMCDYGWYKPTQANDNCTQCGMAGIVRKVTKERGSVNKASCVSKLPSTALSSTSFVRHDRLSFSHISVEHRQRGPIPKKTFGHSVPP